MIKKLIYILIMIIIPANFALAVTQGAYVEYNVYQYAFKPNDKAKFIENANTNIQAWETSKNNDIKKHHLQEAMRYYFLVSQIDNSSIDAQIGLGRIYDEMKSDRLAKEHFFLAYNADNHNPKLNFYFGNFYYKRNDLITALFHYKRAYNYGYSNNYYLNYRLGLIYEKLADIETSKKFYIKAQKLNPNTPGLDYKIGLLDELKYSESQYYLFKETGNGKKRDK